MIEEKIYIRYIGDKFHLKTIQIHVADIEYVEQLIDRALGDIGIGPVYGSLFGLKLTTSRVWLRPNVPIRTILACIHPKRSNFEDAKLELRMQFRPFDFARLAVQDKIAFDTIFAQVRTDFMKTRFNNEKRDFVLLNNAVLSLIVLDLIRYAIENSINIDEVLEKINPRDFIPKRSARWQRPLLVHLAGKTNLEKALQTGYEQCDGDVNKIKQKYLELFLLQVAKDYGADEYTVRRAMPNQIGTQGWQAQSDPQLVRVHYSCSKLVSNCTIESKFIDKSPITVSEPSLKSSSTQSEKTDPKTSQSSDDTESWKVLIHIETINHLTISGRVVQVAGRSSPPIRFQFEKNCYAESFVATIDGYYRLMKRWQINICSEIKSPSLVYLKELGSHGPIGYESTRNKLSKSGYDRPGYFLVRRCMEVRNRFLIDTTLQNRVRLSIDIDRIAGGQLFRQVGHSVNKTNFELEIKTVHQDYRQLKHLINDIEIHYYLASETKITHQLKYWIRPDDDDDYPGLLLSVSRAKLKELEDSLNSDDTESIEQLPQVIPAQFIQLTGTTFEGCDNGHIVNLAVFNNERNVIVKKSTHKPNQNDDQVTGDNNMESVSFHFCPNGHDDLRLVNIQDWLFIKVHFIAETVGYMLSGALVQEYLPLGRLDSFLSENTKISRADRLSIAHQLAQALVFLHQRRVIHGKIRCHNVMIHQEEPLSVKLTDPLGSLDVIRDQAFIPTEYFSSSVQTCVKRYYSGIDVWALGTTMWQIFSHGIRPPAGRFANTLAPPHDCSDDIWRLMESCWIVDPSMRASPDQFFRNLCDLFEREKDSLVYITPDYSSQVASNDPVAPRRATWKSILSNISRNHSNRAEDLMPAQMNLSSGCSLFGSQLSLTSCASPSGSDVTKSTVLDFESISEAFDRCVWHIDSNRLKLGPEIGRGSSGVVMKGIISPADVNGDERVVAVKCVDKNGNNIGGSNQMDDLKREFDILKNLDHPNIVKALGYVEGPHIMLVFEYMPLGSLLSCVRNLHSSSDLHELPLHKYALDIASGMSYLEDKQIVHRDLALRNILLSSRNEAKICDFGLAKLLGPSGCYNLEPERALPLRWYAPETISTRVFTHKSDVWSYGVVLWEIYSGGDSPQYSGTYAELSETLKHERLAKPCKCPEYVYNLMLKCWTYEPEDRPLFSRIYSFLSI